MSNLTKASRRISYLLRHAPVEEFKLDKDGWALCADVRKELNITQDQLTEIVNTDGKGRYQLSQWETHIRAVQGHSTDQVERTYLPAEPPRVLYHGTPARNLDSIIETGLNSRERQYVHLSADLETAATVGLRGTDKAVILQIGAEAMANDGYTFYQAENGVWLIDAVIGAKYLGIQEYRSK